MDASFLFIVLCIYFSIATLIFLSAWCTLGPICDAQEEVFTSQSTFNPFIYLVMVRANKVKFIVKKYMFSKKLCMTRTLNQFVTTNLLYSNKGNTRYQRFIQIGQTMRKKKKKSSVILCFYLFYFHTIEQASPFINC
jgi:hypothetical protein